MKIKACEISDEMKKCLLIEDGETLTIRSKKQVEAEPSLWLFYLDDEDGQNTGSIYSDAITPDAVARITAE